ncbi:DMT family transporter [Streptomyces lanatus]|uniref:DMT family transporter n=1 Tax=Streptomyces lanatus TaxID=66900 RepID=A0ABV1XM57_9ACTN|nr:DMT family transporter [Streptomyces lanatus]GHG99345.1 membrane protein [Streptomyces lanatus]
MGNQVHSRLMGVAALVAAVVLWSSFALTVRGIGSSSLTSIDVAFLRFATPVVILAPWLPRTVRALRHERMGVLLMLGIGGLPHFLLSALGGRLTSAALIGLLIPGTVPLFVAVIVYLRWRERISPRQLIALATITAGIAATAIQTTSTATTTGIGVLLTAGCAWAIYTIGLRRTGLGLTGVVLAVCTPATIAAALLAASSAMPSHLMTGTVATSDVLLFTGLQGIGTGLLSTLCYAYAVRALGSTLTATAGAISPVLTALLGIPLFNEPITPGVSAALTLIVTGVMVFNTAPRHRENGAKRPSPGWRALDRTRTLTSGTPPSSPASTSEVA